MKFSAKAILLLLFIFFFNTCLYAKKELVLTKGEQESHFNNISKKILIEAYKKIDIDISFKTYPSLRALVSSNLGDTDGEMHRILGIEKKFKNLIRIPVSINKISIVAFTMDKEIKINKIDDLKHYTVGVRRGIQFAENISDEKNIYKVAKIEQLFNMLYLGRIDVAVEANVAGIEIIKKLKLNGIHISKKPLISKKLYHYLNKKHKKIIPFITNSLQDMKDKNIIKKRHEEGIYKISTQVPLD